MNREESYLDFEKKKIEVISFDENSIEWEHFIVGAFKIEIQNHYIQDVCKPSEGKSAISELGIRLWPKQETKGCTIKEVRVGFVNCTNGARMGPVDKPDDNIVRMYLDSHVINSVTDMLYSGKDVQFIYMIRDEDPNKKVGIIQYYQPEKV
ncbi:hypothetical protein [Marinifilum fragile]|uniref:hypothetical protein n=1 Tax=Marinifilum fragile TaxID=570161 RepID=UPI002AAACE24|nr:hypothetical protein [Marinifilum fragile]